MLYFGIVIGEYTTTIALIQARKEMMNSLSVKKLSVSGDICFYRTTP
jgi:hypothetical protein